MSGTVQPLAPKTEAAPSEETPRVHSSKIWTTYGFSTRNRYCGLGYIHHIWVLGPLGRETAGCCLRITKGLGPLQDGSYQGGPYVSLAYLVYDPQLYMGSLI